jgi:GDPmannose 4,6-dehydratase
MSGMSKTALITGITGQDGTYLAELLISEGYRVYGLVRGQNNPKIASITSLIPEINLVEGDLYDQSSLISALETTQPDEVYNLGAISYVALSFKQAINTGEITGLGVTRLLEAIRVVNPKIRFYQASSSEMFGKVRETPQNELTPFHPRSPYGVAKTYGHFITVNYRESYGMFACSGILFNHESPRRGLEFVTRKISRSVARIKLGLQDNLVLGTLDSQRDWGFAGDYVRAMYLMLQHDTPDDYVVSTGETHSVREFCEKAFGHAGLDWEKYTSTDATVSPRPAEVDLLIGDSTKARTTLGWQPTVTFDELVKMMVDADLKSEEALIKQAQAAAV